MQVLVMIGSGVFGGAGVEFPTFPLSYAVVLTNEACVCVCDIQMAQSASRDDGMSLPPPPCESASSSTLRSVQLDRVAIALQQNSAADINFLQQSQQPSSVVTTAVQHQLAARSVLSLTDNSNRQAFQPLRSLPA